MQESHQQKSQTIYQLLTSLKNKEVPVIDLPSAINKIGKYGLEEARSDLESYLSHSDPLVRAASLQNLCFYYNRENEYVPTAISFLLHDPDADCRSKGARMLSYLKKNMHDNAILRLLAPIVRNPEESFFVRKDAYGAMRSIESYSEDELTDISTDNDLEKKIDWNFVDNNLPVKKAQELLDQVQSGTILQSDLPTILEEMSRSIIPQARLVLESYLSSASPEVRSTALKMLCLYYNQQNNYLLSAEQFLLHDPAVICRVQGANMLGYLKRNTEDPAIYKILAPIVRDINENEQVRKAAYLAFCSIAFYYEDEQIQMQRADFSLQKDVNWDFIDAYLPFSD
ncbi:HEAT repeat domain-containing protein [Tengunoibacter tsumagoiensis]|uniref:HEAT repeat domain-containing protein n=1 Tax=Tengunoibacter tsumagoiensis TaxID=2014871 RepID=A0A401ZY00_9CHLR|nr:HEAT repeat domain-containing protein [Tengunoibacter tsumagoiensis]GCE11719.1 hypothetical protein KTT_15780 [Tengunoibacter tsumagoiensis]